MKQQVHKLSLVLSLAVLIVACTETTEPEPVAAADNDADNKLPEQYEYHRTLAMEAAQGVAANIINLCDIPKPRGERPPYELPDAGDFAAGQVFDNLYYVGTRGLSAWAVKTSEGIILVDALNNDQEAKAIIVTNMAKLGLDPNDIKYVVVSHGHGDHYGGAQYLKSNYGSKVLASEVDWQLMANGGGFDVPHWSDPPEQDLTIEDGAQLTLGDTSITMYLTPGHTAGTLSTLIPVTDNGEPHVAVVWGGTGFNFEQIPENYAMYSDSATRLANITREAQVDVLLSNHGFVDGTPTKLPAVLGRKAGEPHPYVVGEQSVQDFLTVAGECAKARKALL